MTGVSRILRVLMILTLPLTISISSILHWYPEKKEIHGTKILINKPDHKSQSKPSQMNKKEKEFWPLGCH